MKRERLNGRWIAKMVDWMSSEEEKIAATFTYPAPPYGIDNLTVSHHRVVHPATTIMFGVDFYNQNTVIFKDLFNRVCILPYGAYPYTVHMLVTAV